MGLDHAGVFATILRCLESPAALSIKMGLVIDACESGVKHPDWSKLRALPYDDLGAMQAWIRRPFEQEPPTVTLAGLWFGMFNPVYHGRPVVDVYLAGSTEFSLDEGNIEWACRPAYWPENRSACSEILSSIYRIAYTPEKGLGNNAEWSLCLAYGAFLVRYLLDRVEPNLIVGGGNPVGVAVGFDSGDFIVLGMLTRHGFVLRNKDGITA
jgi:hypothetical protein